MLEGLCDSKGSRGLRARRFDREDNVHPSVLFVVPTVQSITTFAVVFVGAPFLSTLLKNDLSFPRHRLATTTIILACRRFAHCIFCGT